MVLHHLLEPGSAAALVALLALAGPGEAGRDGEPVRFNRDVRPLLADRCFHCHGPDEQERKAGLRLDRPDGPDGALTARAGGAPVRPGAPEDSELWYRVTTDVAAEVMPPAGSHKPALSVEEQELIRRWIEAGAEYEDHWAFTPPVQRPEPAVEAASWCAQPLDRFVLSSLEEQGLEPKPEADPRTLLRRVTLDLTGLPPTRAEVHAFLADEQPDAYERLVARLLASPAHGEHMAKYWLDLVRFADTNGVHHDHYRELSPYRDWVIRAFNENLPFDQFATYQLAGDLYPEPSEDQLIASGFHRLHMIIDRGTALPEESFARNVIDRVTAFGTVFLGLTSGCAVCHDHKYDPLTQREFYQLSAFFNNIDADPETGSGETDKRRGLQPPYLELASLEQEARLAEAEARLAEAEARLEARKREHDAAEEARKAELAKALEEAKQARNSRRGERNEVLLEIPAAMVMRERAQSRPAHVLIRGQYDDPGEEVARGTPAFLPPLTSAGPTPTRMDLAHWLLSPEHPLTARVTVNRIWQQFFGVGLVKTSEDLGTQGEWPSDIDLLDHLATSFIESSWDVKALVRTIALSATYRQSSAATRAEFEHDPENRLLARGPRFRMDSEMIRDQVLATSGLLNPAMYGRSVKPPQPEGVWRAVTLPSSFPRVYEADTGDRIYRRSLYTFWKRGMPPSQMSILDAPTRESCTARRERTNTPLQALLLLNEAEYLKAARALAQRTLSDDVGDDLRVARIYEGITSRLPDEVEADALSALLADLRRLYSAETDLADQLCEGALQPDQDAVELAAWTMLVSTIYNLDISKTRE